MLSEYISILIWIGFVALASKYIRLTKKETVIGYTGEVERYYWIFAFVVFFPIIWMAGHRNIFFGDTNAYRLSFLEAPQSFLEIPEYLSKATKDAGFYLFASIIKIVFGNNLTLFFTILAMIQGLSVLSLFRKYSSNYIFSVFLFVASTDYISWMYNGVRQFTAVTVILAATSLILKRKYLPVILIILLAATVHQSALVMIPCVLIAYGKAWNKRTFILIILLILAIVFLGNFTQILNSSLSNTQYSNVVRDYTEWKDNGTHPLRVLLYSIPTILAFIGRKKIIETDSILLNFCVNMSIISTSIYVLSMFTSGIFLGRLPIFCSLYGYILLAWELQNLFSESARRFMFIGVILLYLGFYYFQMSITWGFM